MAKRKTPGTQLTPVTAKAPLEPGEEALDETRERIRREANPAFQKKLDEMQEWFDREARYSIKARWELGLLIKEIHDDVIEHRGGRYGIHAIEQIAEYFGWDEGVIYNSLRLAQKYTQDEIDELCEKRMPNGQLLSYSHLMSVITLEKPERQKLIDKAVAENLTSTELARFVVQGKEPARLRKDDHRGRPIGKPKTFDAEVAQIESFVSDFLSRAEQVWYSDDYSLDAKLGDFSNEDYTDERANQVTVLAEQMGKLTAMSKKLQELLLHIRGIFTKIQRERKPAATKMVGNEKGPKKGTNKTEPSVPQDEKPNKGEAAE